MNILLTVHIDSKKVIFTHCTYCMYDELRISQNQKKKNSRREMQDDDDDSFFRHAERRPEAFPKVMIVSLRGAQQAIRPWILQVFWSLNNDESFTSSWDWVKTMKLTCCSTSQKSMIIPLFKQQVRDGYIDEGSEE